ncbi:hypothetical protein BGZ46_005554 [Entomortierella lignicola]|nr:hypothetical protein BGZ46_005554 [Entomortierella lignicola]
MKYSIKIALSVALAMLFVSVNAQAQETFPRTNPNLGTKLNVLAVGPYSSGIGETLEKRACTSGCCDPVYSLPCGQLCCKTLTCSLSGTSCGCAAGSFECSDGSGCCPYLSTCAPNNMCKTTTFGGSGKNSAVSGKASSGAMAAAIAMAAVFVNA